MKPHLILEYCTPLYPPRKRVHYRIVKTGNGYCRGEKKGLQAKTFKTYCWGGSEESHYDMALWVCRRK